MSDTTREAVTHDLKIWPVYFESVADGRKTFEIRTNDRDFREGDTLHLREWVPAKEPRGDGDMGYAEGYTGRVVDARVTYCVEILDSDNVGMSIALADEEAEHNDKWIQTHCWSRIAAEALGYTAEPPDRDNDE